MKTTLLKMMLQMLLHPGAYTCRDTARLLFDFVEGELPADKTVKLEKHLRDCPECLEFVRTYRATIALTHRHGLPKTEMPPQLQWKLREFIAQNPDLA
jgi:anti-sigma factor RsiW